MSTTSKSDHNVSTLELFLVKIDKLLEIDGEWYLIVERLIDEKIFMLRFHHDNPSELENFLALATEDGDSIKLHYYLSTLVTK